MDNLNIIKTVKIAGVSIDFNLTFGDTVLRLENTKLDICVADFIWTNKAKQFDPITGKSNYKKDYVIDLEFEDDWGSGTLLNCFFMINQDSIELIFDHFKYQDKSETFTATDFKTFMDKLCRKLSNKNMDMFKQRSVTAIEDRSKLYSSKAFKYQSNSILNQMLEENPEALLYKPRSWFVKKFIL